MAGEFSELSFFKFNVWSSEEISSYSVAEIVETKTFYGPGCLYDERMGLTEDSKLEQCVTCRQKKDSCPGHFGHIRLAAPILHPMLLEEILTFLRVICFHCHLPIFKQEHLRLLRIARKRGNYKVISQLAKKHPLCANCMCNQPTYTLIDCKVNYFYKEKADKIELTTSEIDHIFGSLKQKDLKVLGITPDIHPCNMILKVIPVCPPCTRPNVVIEDQKCEDDITLKYSEILKCNKLIEKEQNPAKKKSYTNILEFHVSTLFDNSKGKARQINGRPLKGIRERINGKSGRIRNNLMGKRNDFCARTVIGADPTLMLNEVGFPEEFAEKLTIPEVVNRINYNHLMELIRKNKVNRIIRGEKKFNLTTFQKKDKYEKSVEDLVMTPSGLWVPIERWELMNGKQFKLLKGQKVLKKNCEIIEGKEEEKEPYFELQMGDIVERQLRNGDRVILNRQPTLHKGSMLCPKIRILKGRTLRLPISICSAYNADFDGDRSCLQQ
jgi:DNA-directed RNA polymerase beta' subunit